MFDRKLKNIEYINYYFPNLNEWELPDRAYLWNVLNTLKPKSTKAIINQAIKNRNSENEDEDETENMIEIVTD